MKDSHLFWLSRSKGMTVDIWIILLQGVSRRKSMAGVSMMTLLISLAQKKQLSKLLILALIESFHRLVILGKLLYSLRTEVLLEKVRKCIYLRKWVNRETNDTSATQELSNE
jgi:hypothetical protein